MALNVYRISQHSGEQHGDFFDAAVMVAESEDAARHMCPSRVDDRGWAEDINSVDNPSELQWYEQEKTWAYPVDDVTVECLGPVTDSKITKPCLILASYNAN